MFEAILAPFRWLMSWLLGAFHTVLEFAGMPANSSTVWNAPSSQDMSQRNGARMASNMGVNPPAGDQVGWEGGSG